MPAQPKYSVLCFGDSNTWGFVPGNGARYDAGTRWPGVLQQELGTEYRVIEEGFNGRTTVWDDPTVPGRNGQQYLVPCLGSHRPLNLVVLFLGINDLKAQFAATAEDIARGASTLMRIIGQSESGLGGGRPKILVMSPPRIGKLTQYAAQFDGSQEKSARLGNCMRAAAREAGCEFLDTTELIVTSDADGIHLEKDAHRTLGAAVAQRVRQMLAGI
jgi:lysophospholipase L1-like esterase